MPAFLAWLNCATAGVATAAGGVATAFYGFSSPAMDISMTASVAMLVWLVLTGIAVRRQA